MHLRRPKRHCEHPPSLLAISRCVGPCAIQEHAMQYHACLWNISGQLSLPISHRSSSRLLQSWSDEADCKYKPASDIPAQKLLGVLPSILHRFHNGVAEMCLHVGCRTNGTRTCTLQVQLMDQWSASKPHLYPRYWHDSEPALQLKSEVLGSKSEPKWACSSPNSVCLAEMTVLIEQHSVSLVGMVENLAWKLRIQSPWHVLAYG